MFNSLHDTHTHTGGKLSVRKLDDYTQREKERREGMKHTLLAENAIRRRQEKMFVFIIVQQNSSEKKS